MTETLAPRNGRATARGADPCRGLDELSFEKTNAGRRLPGPAHDSDTTTGLEAGARPTLRGAALETVTGLPKELGVLLMTAGAITGMLPPPPGPFDLSLILSGGLVLWPRGLRVVERWTREHWPGAHRGSIVFLNRYRRDLENRYPGFTWNADRPVTSEIVAAQNSTSPDSFSPSEVWNRAT